MIACQKRGVEGEQGKSRITLGQRLKFLRQERGWSLERLSVETKKFDSKRIGISGGFINQIELGKKDVTSGRLLLIANALKCSVDYLLTGEEPKAVELRAVDEYFEKVKQTILKQAGVPYDIISPKDRKVLDKFKKLPEEKQKDFLIMLEALLEEKNVKKEDS